MMSTDRFLIVLLLVAMVGCDGLFQVENPSYITEDELADPEMVDALANSGEALFGEGLTRAILSSDLVGDGIMFVGSVTEYQRLDQGFYDIRATGRTFTIDETYTALSEARWMAADARSRIEGLIENPGSDVRYARTHFFDGMSQVVLADLFEQVTYDGEAPVSDVEAYQNAIERFTRAHDVAVQGGDQDYQAAALAARARAKHGIYAETDEATWLADAAADAEAAMDVHDRHVLELRFDISGTQNIVSNFMNRGQIDLGVGQEYFRLEDPSSGQIDPRVNVGEFGGILAAGDSLYFQEKFPTRSDNIPIVRWQESNLIQAEYHIESGDIESALTFLNDNRADVGLPPLTTDNLEEARSWLIHERKAEFWLEARRLQDMRRFNQLPTDRWSPGAIQEGTDRKFPIPITEQNANPHL